MRTLRLGEKIKFMNIEEVDMTSRERFSSIRWKESALSIIALFILIPGLAFGEAPAVKVEVDVGRSQILKVGKDIKKAAVSNKDVADIETITPRQLMIIGKNPGSTNLIIWDDGGTSTFFDLAVKGLDFSLLSKDIKELTGEDVDVKVAQDTVILSGKVSNVEDIKKAEDIAKSYAPKVINLIKLTDPQQVVLQVKVAEVSRSALRDLGINFSAIGNEWGGASYNGGTFAGPRSTTVGSTSGITTGTGALANAGNVVVPGVTLGADVSAALVQFPSNLNTMIKALDKKGLFKTLAEPNLVVKSGEKGKFHAGQKIPYQTTTITGTTTTSTVTFEDVGVTLDFGPTVNKDGLINLKIDPVEVSTIDVTSTVLAAGQFPIINTRTTSTVVDLKEGDSLILSGLISNEASRALSKFPILGDIPILGALFRSKNFQNKETELIVMITPHLRKSISAGQEPDLKGMTTVTPAEEDRLRWIPLRPDMSEGVVKEEKKEEMKKE